MDGQRQQPDDAQPTPTLGTDAQALPDRQRTDDRALPGQVGDDAGADRPDAGGEPSDSRRDDPIDHAADTQGTNASREALETIEQFEAIAQRMEAAADRIERGIHELTTFKRQAVKAWQGEPGDLINFAIDQIRRSRCQSSLLHLDNTMLRELCYTILDPTISIRKVADQFNDKLRREHGGEFMISDRALYRFAKRFQRVYFELKQAAF